MKNNMNNHDQRKMHYNNNNGNMNNFSSNMVGFNMDNVLDSVLDDIDDMLLTSIPALPAPKTSPSNSYSSSTGSGSGGVATPVLSNSSSNGSNNNRPISPASNNGDNYCNNNNYFIPNNNPNPSVACSANTQYQTSQISSQQHSNYNNQTNRNNNGTYVYGNYKSQSYNNNSNTVNNNCSNTSTYSNNNGNNFVYGSNVNCNSVVSYNKGKKYMMKKQCQSSQQVNNYHYNNMKNRVQMNDYNQRRNHHQNNYYNQRNQIGNESNDAPIYKPAKVSMFEAGPEVKLQLKDYVFISKDCTAKLAQYLVKEEWGKSHALLYKYLDYIFRCQAFGKQSIVIQHCQTPKKFLLFNSGLQRKCDNKTLYALLIPNNIPNSQPWRVPFGPIENSFLSKDELFKKLQRCNMAITDQEELPERTKFNTCLGDLLYDESYAITANWEERLMLNKDRIYKVMGSIAFFDDNKKFMKTHELIEAFNEALPKTQRIAELNPRLAVAQGFVDTTNAKYRMELLLPIIIKFPLYCGNYYKFALAIGKSKDNKERYIVKSILTMDMAYANARLVGYVDSLWLNYSNHKKNKSDINDLCVSP